MEAWREDLYHHGILGQKWGVRRFQNKDGSLTSKGKARYKDSGTQTGSAKPTNSDKPVSKRTLALHELTDKHEKFKQNVAKGKSKIDKLLSISETYSLSRAIGNGKLKSFGKLMMDNGYMQTMLKEGYIEDYKWNHRND